MKKHRKKVIVLLSVILCVLIIVALFVGKNNEKYVTWEDYQRMSEEEQMKFIDSFDEEKDFEEWMESVKPSTKYDLPWEEEGAKNVKDYSWEEFQALDQIQQEIFINSFNEEFTFELWLEREKPKSEDEMAPWDKEKAKQPEEYTWKDYEALTEIQQMMFIDYMDNKGGFEKWLNENKPNK